MNHDDKQLWDLLGSAKRPGAPDGFVASVMDRIALERQPSQVTWFERMREFLKPSPLTWAAATGAAAVLCALLVLNVPDAGQDRVNLASEIDDQLLLDIACKSLGDEELQTALYQMASVDAQPMADRELAEILFNG